MDDDPTDRLFDTSPAALAERFGDRTKELLRSGRDCRDMARLAVSYAFLAKPVLRMWELQ